MSENLTSKIILNDIEISIPRQFQRIGAISPKIFNKLVYDPFTYVIKASISEDTYRSFLKYLCEDAELKISIENYFELIQISDEFQFSDMKNLLLAKKTKWEEYEKIIEDYQINREKDKIFFQNFILDINSKIENCLLKQKIEYESLISELVAKIQRLEDYINEQKIIIEDNKSSIDSNNQQINEIKTEINNICSNISNQHAKNAQIENELDEIKTKLELHYNQVNEIISNLNFQQELDQFNTNINMNLVQIQNKQNDFVTKNDLKTVITQGQSYYKDALSCHATVPVNYENNYWAWMRAVQALPSHYISI